MEKGYIQTRAKQQGVAILTVAIIILVLITLLVFISARTTKVVSQVSSNDFRAKQAFEAAEAGLAYAHAYYTANGLSESSPGVLDTSALVLTGGAAPAVTAGGETIFNNYGTTPGFRYVNDLAGNPTPRFVEGRDDIILVRSEGVSDDEFARHVIQTYMSYTDLLPDIPEAPLISRTYATLSGNFNVENAYSNLTVRSGDAYTKGVSSNTYICEGCANSDPTNYARPTDGKTDVDGDGTNEPDKTLLTNNGGAVVYIDSGIDVIDHDPYLAAATPDEFFHNFFALDRLEVKALSNIYSNVDDLAGVTNELIWFEGDLKTNVGGGNKIIGTQDEPVILIVNGNLTPGGGTVDVYGMVYVIGDVNGTGGTFNVFGAAAIEGSGGISASGTMGIYYDPVNALGPNNAGQGTVVGTWRDW